MSQKDAPYYHNDKVNCHNEHNKQDKKCIALQLYIIFDCGKDILICVYKSRPSTHNYYANTKHKFSQYTFVYNSVINQLSFI